VRRRAPRPVGVALERALASVAPATLLAEVQRVWPEAVGPLLADVSRPVGEKAGTIRVDCSSAVFAQELDLMGERVVAALNARLAHPRVKGVRCGVRSAQRYA
jgi:predicted nucleic acid-binding Zn ribbon protein